jgi:hypothetical protein
LILVTYLVSEREKREREGGVDKPWEVHHLVVVLAGFRR